MVEPRRAAVAVVGGGPAGLMAAEVLATAGAAVTVFEQMPTVGRKLLLAGRSGLNLTHSEPLDALLERYGPARARLVGAIERFGPDALRAWAAGLGEPTFVGTSGRVFPVSFRASGLLRAWLARLEALGVAIRTRHRWLGWDAGGALRFSTGDGAGDEVTAAADACVLALGGASWARTGSDGAWVPRLEAAGVDVAPLRPSNCGFVVAWSDVFATRFAGAPLKDVVVGHGGRSARGDLVVTDDGLEGGPVYALSSPLRDAIDAGGPVTVTVDLFPGSGGPAVAARLGRRRAKDSISTALRRAGVPAVAVGLLREATGNRIPTDAGELAALLRAVPVRLEAAEPVDRAISTAGGVRLDALDGRFMLRDRPGTFVAGEMLDWDAPTGGYLLQASCSTGVAAAEGVLSWWATPAPSPVEEWREGQAPSPVEEPREGQAPAPVEEIVDGDTVWRFDTDFLRSRWTCIFGRGCLGILPEPAEHLGHGCCSLGADLDGDDEARTVAALAATLAPERFQHHAEVAAGGALTGDRAATRVVDGACVFLNRPGFPGGAGCALHLAALDAGESPVDWKPSVCWQLPIKVDWEPGPDDTEVATVRRWSRADWGAEGETMAWCCTEGERAYVGEVPVLDAMADELEAIVGTAVHVELRRRLAR